MENNENNEELVELTLNNAGEDYVVVVSLDTANILLNDADEARQYLLRHGAPIPGSSEEETEGRPYMVEQDNREGLPKNAVSPVASIAKQIWTSKKPSEIDHEATKYFLELRKQFASKFDDKKSVKNQLWAAIAKKMTEKGFNVGEKKDAIEKLRLKFSNLQKAYLGYIKHVKTTGVEKKDPPIYFDDMHEILGGKDKSDPKYLQDSEENPSENITDDSSLVSESDVPSGVRDVQSESGSDNTTIINRFKTCRIRPTSTTEKIIELIKKQHEEDSEERRQHFRQIKNLMKTQNEQRGKLIENFETLIELEKQKQKKRKRPPSSDEED